jgi:hypothetical protein
LKGLLLLLNTEYRRSHDLVYLVSLLNDQSLVDALVERARQSLEALGLAQAAAVLESRLETAAAREITYADSLVGALSSLPTGASATGARSSGTR